MLIKNRWDSWKQRSCLIDCAKTMSANNYILEDIPTLNCQPQGVINDMIHIFKYDIYEVTKHTLNSYQSRI